MNIFDAAQMEACKSENRFDDAEHRFDGRFSFPVFLLGLVCLKFLLHCDAPRGGYPWWRLGGLFWGSEVIGTLHLLARNGDQGFDAAVPKCLNDLFSGITGITQERGGLANGIAEPSRVRCRGAQVPERIAEPSHQSVKILAVIGCGQNIGREDQRAAIGIDNGLRVIGLAIFMPR